MPELPEVQTIVAQLGPSLRGRRVRRVEVFDPKLKELGLKEAEGLWAREVSRRGKLVVVELAPSARAPGVLWLCVHLRMSGRLFWEEGEDVREDPPPRARFVLEGGVLSFHDRRRLGVVRLCRSADEAAPTGRDPLEPGFTRQALARLFEGSTQEIKPWLMRQDRLAGVGNIYASEILFAAGIDPRRKAGGLSDEEVRRLWRVTRSVLRRAIRCCGVTFSDFQDSRGRIGSYQRYLRVYGREGERCVCGRAAIERIVQQQRSTFFCSRCQR